MKYALFLFFCLIGTASAQVPHANSTVAIVVPQQSPQGDTYTVVPANTSTLIWTLNGAARILRIIPNTQTCTMECDATAQASANSTPIPGGYVFNLIEPPPAASCYAYCTSTTTFAVSQGN